jgi:hypothetical protein
LFFFSRAGFRQKSKLKTKNSKKKWFVGFQSPVVRKK